jgi:hypothetical protein
MCHKGELSKVDTRGAGQTETPIEDLYFGFVRLVLFHLSPRPDLQVLWAMEGMLKRMAKRALLSSHVARKDIAAGVEMQRYLQPEEKIAYLGPSPARTLIQAVESIALAELGAFFTRHWNKGGNRKFDVRSATEEFQTKRRAFEPLEDATDADYRKLAADLGQEWSELTWSHELNRSWDRLGHAVCEIVLAHRGLLNGLPDDCRSQLIELSRLGNSFARQCLEALGMDVPADYSDAQDRLRAMFRLEAS